MVCLACSLIISVFRGFCPWSNEGLSGHPPTRLPRSARNEVVRLLGWVPSSGTPTSLSPHQLAMAQKDPQPITKPFTAVHFIILVILALIPLFLMRSCEGWLKDEWEKDSMNEKNWNEYEKCVHDIPWSTIRQMEETDGLNRAQTEDFICGKYK